jgi:hypothetical protein
MYRLWQIILWRHRPAMAVETNLVDIIRIGFTFFANDDIVFRLQHDKAFRAKVRRVLTRRPSLSRSPDPPARPKRSPAFLFAAPASGPAAISIMPTARPKTPGAASAILSIASRTLNGWRI